MPFVVDASVALAWHFPDEETALTAALIERSLHDTMVVPQHWFAEVANGMLVGERRKRATLSQSSDFIAWIASCILETDIADAGTMFATVLPLARAHRLTIYDAIYLELAERRGLPLATLDGDLAAAARLAGVELLA